MSAFQQASGFVDGGCEQNPCTGENFAWFPHSQERFLKALMSVTMRQIEVTQGLMEGGVADLDLLTRARTPGAFVQAELEIMRRCLERVTNATRRLSDELGQALAEN